GVFAEPLDGPVIALRHCLDARKQRDNDKKHKGDREDVEATHKVPPKPARCRKFFRQLYPTLKLAQNELADDVHAGIAVVEAGNGGKLLAAVVLEDFGIFLRDLLQ